MGSVGYLILVSAQILVDNNTMDMRNQHTDCVS